MDQRHVCEAIGISVGKLPPEEAIYAVRKIMVEFTKGVPEDPISAHLARIDAYLLEAWRIAALDPDDQVFLWLTQGAPAGILRSLVDPGIVPSVWLPRICYQLIFVAM